ncbi:hypothetical protein [Photorhabdus heterorhabditis]|uniref:Uncharacterized protein n=1 Tax=Photorhabdus heterorhabditis TaxID=880156 RepID=A0A5B0WT93_9GAMM|nr:hypothetical protein [Photorhabdus heterorhabditis]KAA1189089.1 hypothetical protein F0L16_10895 [Photorhabdus heterorhabditis]KOY63584.1 hypothetical protein AM629_01910 [Photorhabdus heterorhabditis]
MMTDKEISTVDSLKASFESGVPPAPEAFFHLIDEAYKAYEIIDGGKGDGPAAGLKRDDKGKLALNTHLSGGLNLEQGALALSLKPEGGFSFDGGRRLKLDADRQVKFADFFSLSRWERIEITQLLGVKRAMMARMVSPSPKANERFGTSISLNAAGDYLAVGMDNKVCVYTGRKGEWNISAPTVFENDQDKSRSSWDVSLNAVGDCLAVGYLVEYYMDVKKVKAYVYTRTNGVWDTKNPIVFPLEDQRGYSISANVCLSAAGDSLVVGGASMSYIYTRTNGIWDTENSIQLPYFTTVCLSASGNCLAGYISKAVSVYTRTNGIWDTGNYVSFIASKDNSSSFNRIFSLNAAGDRLAVGVDYDVPTEGKVYLYTRTNGIWDTENPIKFSAPASDVTYFGSAIKLNDVGNRLVVGAASRVYVYTCLNNKWNMETPIEILDPSGNSDNLNGFGKAISLNRWETCLAVGAVSAKVGSVSEAGAVYVFENVK